MDALALLIYAAEWALFGIILYFVIGMIPMPEWAKRAAQALLIVLGVLAILKALLGSPVPVSRLSPIPPGPPSITK
jgi:cell division protein FtsW (lipid II flippase)